MLHFHATVLQVAEWVCLHSSLSRRWHCWRLTAPLPLVSVQVIGMTFGQQQMVVTRVYSYIVAASQQVGLLIWPLNCCGACNAALLTCQIASASQPPALCTPLTAAWPDS